MNQTCVNIYSLVDPINGKVRYVGKTKLPLEKRLIQHIGEAKSIINGGIRRKNNKRYSWIISLINSDKEAIIVLLESCSVDNWEERESFWISNFNNLTNMTKGGDGGDTNSGRKFGKPSDETIKKISENTRIAMKSEDIRIKCRNGYNLVKDRLFNSEGKLKKGIREKISNSLKKPFNLINIESNKILNCECIKDACLKTGLTNKQIKKVKKGYLKYEYTLLEEKDLS